MVISHHANSNLKKKTVQKLKQKEDNWNSYLTENKFKITDEERIEKKKQFVSKNNCMIKSNSADGSRNRNGRKHDDVNALDLLMFDDECDKHAQGNDDKCKATVHRKPSIERHKTFLPISPSSSSSSTKVSRKTHLPLKSPSAVKKRVPNDIVMLSEYTEIDDGTVDHDSVHNSDHKILHGGRSSAVSSNRSKSSRQLFVEDPDPDWKHITNNIRSLYAELRYYEELSGKRSILDTRDEIDDMLRDKELNDPRSSKAIMQYLLELVCQSLTYLLKNEVELQNERSKNDLLNAQLDEYRSSQGVIDGGLHEIHPGAGSQASIASMSHRPVHTGMDSDISRHLTDHDQSLPPHASRHSESMPMSTIPIALSSDASSTPLVSQDGSGVLTLSKMQALSKHSDPYVDAYESYMESPDRRVRSVIGEHSGGGGNDQSQQPLNPSVDLSRLDALIDYSKAINVDNECSTIDRLSSTATVSRSLATRGRTVANGLIDGGYDSDDSFSLPPPPPPTHHGVGSSSSSSSSYRLSAPPPPTSMVAMERRMSAMGVVNDDRSNVMLAMSVPTGPWNEATPTMRRQQASNVDVTTFSTCNTMTNHTMPSSISSNVTPSMSRHSIIPLDNTQLINTNHHLSNVQHHHHPQHHHQFSHTKAAPSPMAMNGSSASDWLFFDFSTPAPSYMGLPPHQPSATATTQLYPTGITKTDTGSSSDKRVLDVKPSMNHQSKSVAFTTQRLDDRNDQSIEDQYRWTPIPEHKLQKASLSTASHPVTEQVSIVQPLVDVPVPHIAPTHPYSNSHRRNNNNNNNNTSSSSTGDGADHVSRYPMSDDSGLSPIAKELMNQYRLPLQQRTFDARNGSF